MRYKGTLIAVKNMESAKAFYKELLGLEVINDCGANVELTDGIFLQTVETWPHFIGKKEEEIIFENNAAELYFETEDMDAFEKKLLQHTEINYVYPLKEESWGQRTVRFYDKDHHIVEVGEKIESVVKRFIAQGFSIEEIAKRMDVSIDYIKKCL